MLLVDKKKNDSQLNWLNTWDTNKNSNVVKYKKDEYVNIHTTFKLIA